MRSAEFIYEKASFPSCHASTIVETTGGDLVAAWFGGSRESAADTAIYLSRRSRHGWAEPLKVADGAGLACYNPVFCQLRNGPLLLFYKVGTGPQTWRGMMTRSHDDGHTWDAPSPLPSGIFGPIKNKPFERADGVLLCPSSDEADGWKVHVERTSDAGRTWWRSTPLNDGKAIGAIQPSLLPMGDDRLRAVGRTRQGRLFAIDSSDMGESWGEMRLLDVPNPNSGTDAIRLADGRYLLVFNETTSGRSPLNVAISSDAEHWRNVLDLETEHGEYSYPAVIQSQDGRVHITYTWRRQRIRYVVIDPKADQGWP